MVYLFFKGIYSQMECVKRLITVALISVLHVYGSYAYTCYNACDGYSYTSSDMYTCYYYNNYYCDVGDTAVTIIGAVIGGVVGLVVITIIVCVICKGKCRPAVRVNNVNGRGPMGRQRAVKQPQGQRGPYTNQYNNYPPPGGAYPAPGGAYPAPGGSYPAPPNPAYPPPPAYYS